MIVLILKGHFLTSLPSKPDAGKSFKISNEQGEFIRFLWVSWLNRLEGILAAWQQGAADEKLMKKEFTQLIKLSQDELEVLISIRRELPIVTAFYNYVLRGEEIQVRRSLSIWPFRRRSN